MRDKVRIVVLLILVSMKGEVMIRAGILMLVLCFGLSACDKICPKYSGSIKTDEEKASYAIGQQIGNGLKNQGIEANPDIIAMSITDVLKGQKVRMTPEEMQDAIKKMQESATNKLKKVAEENKTKGDKFLEENKKKNGIKVTASGLQYLVVNEGTGPSPAEDQTVKVNYVGTLIDGAEFDSSVKRGKPAEFPVNRVIPGWTEALKMMKVGAKWKLFIPAQLAYGEQGRPSIPPNSVLVFEVDLLEIVETPAQQPPQPQQPQQPPQPQQPQQPQQQPTP